MNPEFVIMILRTSISILLLLFLVKPAYAIPALIPLLPVIAVLLAKGAALRGSTFFLVLSLYKNNKKSFLIWGIVLIGIFILLLIFY